MEDKFGKVGYPMLVYIRDVVTAPLSRTKHGRKNLIVCDQVSVMGM